MSWRHVHIYYGPCDSFHVRSHKPQKLRGLRDHLQKLGYRVDLSPVEYENYCVVEMCGYEIFRCNLQNLGFNLPYEHDRIAQRAIAAVEETILKFRRARSYLWLWTLIQDNMFRSDLGPKETWTKPLDVKQIANCENCINCCDICVSKK